MPTRPSAARRRLHRDRVVAKRAAQALLGSWNDPADIVRGRLDNEQWYLGCHRARCGLCNADKRWRSGQRERAKLAWRRAEGLN